MMTEGEFDIPLKISGKVIPGTSSRCEFNIPDPCTIIIFGASGDLTKRKIIPSLFRLFVRRLLPEPFFVIGVSRTLMNDDRFRDSMKDVIKSSLHKNFSESLWENFSKILYYLKIEYDSQDTYFSLKNRLKYLEQKYVTGGNRIYYLATPPAVSEQIIKNLGISGLSHEEEGYRHIVVEKPFGSDLESAIYLNRILSESFAEHQVYRMDHYLAKETVQNIIMFRFANSIFEPVWNRMYIDHVQITVAETIGVEERAGYYEKSGIIRDMFQNHIFQLLALTAMEPPARFEAESVRDEKVKVFKSIRPFNLENIDNQVVVGQYGRGNIDGREVVSYREEPGVSPESTTPTFAALKLYIDNWRWSGVPFYLRSGKRLSSRKAEIAIQFKSAPYSMFSQSIDIGMERNALIMRIQPDESIEIHFQAKNPGSRLCLNTVNMNFSYQNIFSLDAYERVLLDCMEGDQMLFVRADGVEQTWALLTPLIERLETDMNPGDFPDYAAGSSGPSKAEEFIKRDGRVWRSI
jgi:glucose-6-phosphate 1-dehydrogenase